MINELQKLKPNTNYKVVGFFIKVYSGAKLRRVMLQHGYTKLTIPTRLFSKLGGNSQTLNFSNEKLEEVRNKYEKSI